MKGGDPNIALKSADCGGDVEKAKVKRKEDEDHD